MSTTEYFENHVGPRLGLFSKEGGIVRRIQYGTILNYCDTHNLVSQATTSQSIWYCPSSPFTPPSPSPYTSTAIPTPQPHY